MNILLPLNSNKEDEAKLCKINEALAWAMLSVKDGEIQQTVFKNSENDFDDFAHILVVDSHDEDVSRFTDNQIEVLVAPTQRYIDDILEAYLFRELHDFNH